MLSHCWRVFFAQHVAMGVEVTFHGRFQLLYYIEETAQKQTSVRFPNPRTEIGQLMMLDQIEVDRGSFVKDLTIWGNQGRYPTCRIDGKELGFSVFVLDDVDFPAARRGSPLPTALSP